MVIASDFLVGAGISVVLGLLGYLLNRSLTQIDQSIEKLRATVEELLQVYIELRTKIEFIEKRLELLERVLPD